ncbi:ABC transporter permease [Ammoniphilus sp. 3BR4]|uniref:ABC transporter permease n=1 Tax=Ammoniphilus sp. 3BR4 TaxID=3158265 RepID=UPI0034669F6B
MNKVRKMWLDRASWFWGDAIRYLRVILTGYMYVPIILLILLAFLYRYILEEFPDTWDIGWILSPILAYALTKGDIRTFVKPPDPMFLLPMEQRLGEYFRLSFLYSGLIQGVTLFFVFLILSPLFYAKISPHPTDFYGAFIILLLIKWSNLLASWVELRFPERRGGLLKFLRLIINLVLCLSIFQVALVPLGILGGLVGGVIFSYIWLFIKSSLFWPNLVEREGKSQGAFYAFAQWFMDVPNYPVKIKRRTFWILLLRWIPLKHQWSHLHLYLRSFIRYEDVSNHYIRLTFLGTLILFFVPSLTWAAIVYLMCLLSNAVQLINSWNRLKDSFWDHVYPISLEAKRRGFQLSLLSFLVIQSICMSFSLFSYGFYVLTAFLTVGGLFSYIIAFPFFSRKLG